MSANVGDDVPNHTSTLKLLDSSLRLSVVPLGVATVWLTVTNEEDNTTFGKLDFSSIMGLKYMVWVSAICAGYAFVAALSSWITCLASKAWLFFVSDQVVAYIMVTSGAAAMERVYLVYNGDKEVSWSEACSSYGRFCSRMRLALVLHGLALCCFLVLALISAFRAFTVFDPPAIVSSKDVVEEEERTS